MDFPDLSASERKRMAEVEDRLRGESGRLPSDSELRRRVEFLETSGVAIQSRDRIDRRWAIAFLVLATPAVVITHYDAFGIELAPVTENIILGSVFTPLFVLAAWHTIKFRKLPVSAKNAELEIKLIKNILNRRDHER